MEFSFAELKNKEVVNVADGKKLGHIVDIIFDASSGRIEGVAVPGDKRLFRKSEDLFVPLEKIRKIGDDVILVSLQSVVQSRVEMGNSYGRYLNYGYPDRRKGNDRSRTERKSFVRYKRIDEKKYK